MNKRPFLERLRLLALQYLHPATYRLEIRPLIALIDEPNRTKCLEFLEKYPDRLRLAHGSTYNHQPWEGGYLDHVTEVMNFARLLYYTLEIIGRPLPFTLSDALLMLFLHDAEKPWKYDYDSQGKRIVSERFATKAAQHTFRQELFQKHGFELTDAYQNALKYVEGEMSDYRGDRRVMNELAAFCHVCDTLSARLFHSYPRSVSDEWPLSS